MRIHGPHVATPTRVFGALCVLAVAVCAAAFVGGASATTAPGYVYPVDAVLTDSGVKLLPHKVNGKAIGTYIRADGRSAQFPRGTLIKFLFTNKGTQSYLPAIRVLDKSQADPYTKVKNLYTGDHLLKPGGHGTLFGNFYFRGAFQIENLLHKKPHGGRVNISIY